MKCFYSPNFSTGLLAYRGWLNQILAVSDRNLLFWLLSHWVDLAESVTKAYHLLSVVVS